MAVYNGVGGVVEFSLSASLLASSDDVGEGSRLLQDLDTVVLSIGNEHVSALVEADSHGFLELSNSGSGLAVGGSDGSANVGR